MRESGRALRFPANGQRPAARASISRSCISSVELLDPTPHEQVGRHQGRLVPSRCWTVATRAWAAGAVI